MSERSSRLKAASLMIVYVALSVVVASAPLAALVLISDRPEIRYHKQYSDLRQAIYEQKGSVDIAVGGSSRVRRGMFEPFLQKSLAPYFGGRQPVIYNLGLAGNGTDAQIRILLELLERRKVDYIFFQLYQVRDNKFSTHRNLRKFGTLEDILWTPIGEYGWAETTSHRLQLLYQRISEMLDNCVAEPASCESKPARLEDAKSTDKAAPRVVDVERQQRFLRNREEKRGGEYFRDPPRSWTFESGRDARTAYYLDRLISVARAKGTTVVFIDLAKFEWNTLAEGFPEYVKKRFGVDYLYLDAEELRELGKVGYGDYGHVNLRGEPTFRRMIVDYFKRRSTEPDDGSTVAHSGRGS
jgi:hypothetical protein